ncbi:hypothetical protein [Candidatus Villigracilis affinis]|uniref:hypothetical protein n=1 Tax=Candidatus Villigracilis affinis TaxID=3140682 RepID=UPI002A1E41D4|nr:hypothetical protein [Anaerolineales bacterium]
MLELNPSHNILKNLLKQEAGSELQSIIIEQILRQRPARGRAASRPIQHRRSRAADHGSGVI